MIKPFEPYKIDQGFGSSTPYGPHEGWDLNQKGTSGNQDCGTPLKAVGDGDIVHYSESTKDYGNLAILYLKGSFGERWIRYCHCQEVVVKSGIVKTGDIVALMGSTGNSTACHLHFDVFKKKPPTWRWFAKTQALHSEYFEDPELFFDLPTTNIDQMAQWLINLFNENGVDITKPEGEIRGKIQEILDGAKKYVEKEKRIKELEDKLAKAEGEAAEYDIRLQTLEKGRADLEKEVKDLREQIVTRDTEINRLTERIKQLEIVPNTGGSYIPSSNMITRILRWLFRRKG